MEKDKLKIGIYELTGCAGDALLILDCEKELVDIFKAADITSFLMAKSDNIEGELDVALVEGSVTTEREKKEVLDIRKRAEVVVAIGTCACFGGIQAAFLDKNEWENKDDPYEACSVQAYQCLHQSGLLSAGLPHRQRTVFIHFQPNH
jgi:coenzyme F420-reducing hydrogenase gamma subunit